jgi:heme-degrading monooxygenase HmoA
VPAWLATELPLPLAGLAAVALLRRDGSLRRTVEPGPGRYRGGMIVEHALLPVRPGHEDEFERAFAVARPLIEGRPGFLELRLSRGVESPSAYLLLVWWESVEAHEQGFRGSPEYQQWRRLLHGFYEPFPVVEHFAPLG